MITNVIALNKNPMLKEFKNYVLSFYGYDGLYPIEGLTSADVDVAIVDYSQLCGDPQNFMEWGDGDSLDRERVRDILLKNNDELELHPTVQLELI